MTIGIMAGWYRPYFITVNNKEYRVNTIKFYKDNDVVVASQSAWLERADGTDIKKIELPIDEIKLKRKEKFDGSVFAISLGKGFFDSEPKADLYIPADMLNIRFTKHEIKYQQLRTVYEGEQGIYISSFVKSLTEKLMLIRSEYEEVYKQLDDSKMSITKAEIVFDNINRLKELAEEYKAEQKRVHDLTVEDVVKDEG